MKIKNNTKRPVQFDLPHKTYCINNSGKCSCKPIERTSIVHDRKSGDKRPQLRKMLICASVIIRGGQTVEVAQAAKLVPAIAAAAKARTITIL